LSRVFNATLHHAPLPRRDASPLAVTITARKFETRAIC